MRNGNSIVFRLAGLLVAIIGCDGPIVGPGLEPPGSPGSTRASEMARSPAAGSGAANTPTPATSPPANTGGGLSDFAPGPMAGQADPMAMTPTDGGNGAEPGTAPPTPMPTGPDAPASPDPSDAPDLSICDSAQALPLGAELAFLPMLARPSSSPSDTWAPLRSGVSRFIADPESAGLSVSIYGSRAGAPGACPTGAAPLTPFAILPQPALGYDLGLLLATGTQGGQAAVGEALDALSARSAPPTEQARALVVLTDAAPRACDGSADELATLAARALSASPSVRTYIVTLGGEAAAYDAVAAAGGSEHARRASLDPDAVLDTLRSLRRELRDCTFDLPEMTGGFDASLMRLVLTEDAGSRPLSAVADREGCAGGEGFYFDRPRAPTRIHVCPAVCQELDGGAVLRTDTLCDPATRD